MICGTALCVSILPEIRWAGCLASWLRAEALAPMRHVSHFPSGGRTAPGLLVTPSQSLIGAHQLNCIAQAPRKDSHR